MDHPDDKSHFKDGSADDSQGEKVFCLDMNGIHAGDAFHKGQSEFGDIFDYISLFMIRLSPEREILEWTAAAEKILGLKTEDVKGKSIEACEILWDWKRIEENLFCSMEEGSPIRVEDLRLINHHGKERFVSLTIIPVREKGKEASSIVLLGYDVTQRRMLQIQLAESRKLDSIGRLASGIAHEVNVPIQYVGDNMRFLKEAYTDLVELFQAYQDLMTRVKSGNISLDCIQEMDQAAEKADWEYLENEIPKAIDQTLEGVERVSQIIQAMKDFSHPGVGKKVALDINQAIESTVMVARNEWKYVAEMITDFDPLLPPVPCFPGEFNQAILNIVVNAAHAIGDVVGDGTEAKGTIRISTKHEKYSVVIRIQDTGTGIPEEIWTKIFDPFFTNKDYGQGTGQGLYIARSIIVDKHGGSLLFETEEGIGTTFIIKLPTGEGEA